MSFEDKLLRGIPSADAAAFFINIKRASAHPEALAEAKRKVAEMGVGSPPPLPQAAMGKTMAAPPPVQLPATAMGQNKVSAATPRDPEEVGRERAHASLSAEFEKEKAHKSERHGDIAGRLLGGLVGGIGMHRYGAKNPMATLGGIALGEHMGGHAGREAGAAHDRARHHKTASTADLVKQALGLAPALDPATQQYIQAEGAAAAAEEQGQSQYLRQLLDKTRAESSAAQEAAQQAQEQATQLEQQNTANAAQMDQYRAQVGNALQNAMTAQDQVLQQQQAAAAMRMSYQQLRGTILQAASADPPALTGTESALAMASQAAAPNSAPSPTLGAADAAPQTPSAPGAAPPEGSTSTAQNAQATEPTIGATAQNSVQVGQSEPQNARSPGKESLASALPFSDSKCASLRDIAFQHGHELLTRLPYAAAGALLGGGAEYAHAHGDNTKLRDKLTKLDAEGDKGVGHALNRAQTRVRLELGDYAHRHPLQAAGFGATTGALTGAAAAPLLRDISTSAKNIFNTLANKHAA